MGKYNSKRVIQRDGKCVYCNSNSRLTTDHVVPISLRESYSLKSNEVHNYGNLVASCSACNQKKGGRKLEEFFQKYPEKRENLLRNARFLSNKIRSLI